MDQRSLSNLNTLHPSEQVREDAIQAWTEVQQWVLDNHPNTHVVVIQGLRSMEESTKDYAQGRTAPGDIVSWAHAGESWHNYALAFDMAMITNGKPDYVVGPIWLKVVSIMKSHGWRWGGPKSLGGSFPEDKPDAPHFEKQMGHTLSQLFNKYKNGDFIPGTKFINL